MGQQQGSGTHTTGNKAGCAGMGGGWALALEWALGGAQRVVGSKRMGCGADF
jgi:hypothetical protein